MHSVIILGTQEQLKSEKTPKWKIQPNLRKLK